MKKSPIILLGLLLILISLIFALQNIDNSPAPIVSIITPQKVIEPIIEPTISIFPKTVLPGDPVFISINSTSTPIELFFDNKKIQIFSYDGKPHALIAIDFNEKILAHIVKAILSNGGTITAPVTLTLREKIERPLGIPEKLGGNTETAAANLVSNLTKENAVLNTLKSAGTILWGKAFVNPLASMIVTDDYGYDRKTVNSTILHKGTDFRAPVGTKVFSMNDGVVKVAKLFTIYGNTIVIDHGLGLQTLYMHLSKLEVKEGDIVKAGQEIGFSGQTGYADQPHLHISIKINGVSIDPVIFLSFFK